MPSHKLIREIRLFLKHVTSNDFAGVKATLPEDKTQLSHYHRARKIKGGKPPLDYHLVEELYDLQLAMDAGRFDEAAALYFKLKKILNY